ncbi:S1C family serine protease [Candidatus Uabimicrobium sp. HlEnr_7]|uniref:S1C family serine protease n=1 Tax=Candidatus Uabimicrobium helgolandensis TaxID=3095367 RepID=UPI003556196E
MHKLYIVLLVLFSTILFAKEPITDIALVSKKVQELKDYAISRTVGIRIIIGDKQGYGSGALVSADGLIVTCAHVVEPGDSLVVVTSDGREYPAQKLGLNSVNDYALIKIKGKEFPYFEYGNSDELSMLEWVVALGHPGGPYFDDQPAVACGRIRGFHKKLPIQMGVKFYDDAIQTDVPIFAGNSGGPLIDLDGKLIGINGAIMLVNELAFSVPINEIVADIKTMTAGRDVKGRSPGNIFDVFMEMQEDLSPEDMMKAFDKSPIGKIFKMFSGTQQMPKKKPSLGVVVREVEPEGLQVTDVDINKIGSLAGVRPGDIIVRANGIPLQLREDLKSIVASAPKSGKVFLTIKRDGKKIRIPVFISAQSYSRDNYFRRHFVYKGLELMETTVKIRKGRKVYGYGVVISEDGWILTANHILSKVQGAVDVQMQDGTRRSHIGIVKGRNGVLDIALIKVTSAKPLKAMKIGDDSNVKIGEWLVSGGTANGIINAGMLSAKNRQVSHNRRVPTLGLFGMFGQPNKSPVRAYDKVFQHDTNLEKKQFGTPLVNMKGELVGINVAYFYRGTAFAIPISSIMKILPDLKASKVISVPSRYKPRPAQVDNFSKILRRFLGDGDDNEEQKSDPFEEILKDLFGGGEKSSTSKGFIGVQVENHPNGVKVVHTVFGKPAHQAGVRNNDVITAVGKNSISGTQSLVSVVSKLKPGSKTTISILRQKNRFNLPITIGKR